jgi:hypothetical protein
MNPYLEQEDVWEDFHQSFIVFLRDALREQVRPKYVVKVEEHLFIHELPGDERRPIGHSDVSIAPASLPPGGRAGVLQAPAEGRLSLAIDVERHGYLEVRDRLSREIVTVIEVLSPSNKKPGPDREQYLVKRRRLLYSPVNLVEIDLLRGNGPRMPVEGLAECAYCVMVSRAEERPRVGLWAIQLREPLPVVPVPLRAADGAARLDLQAVLHRLYDSAGYEDYIYDGAPRPPLSAADAAWAAGLVPGRQRDGQQA